MIKTLKSARRARSVAVILAFGLSVLIGANAQTDCGNGNDPLDTTPPNDMTPESLIQRFTAGEKKVKEAREHYTFVQDLMVQTLNDKTVDGQFHEITNISYDDKGKRVENVTYAEQSTLRSISLTVEDWDDIRVFMPWILTTDVASQYKLTYAGRQHVDDLDTYVFHVEPKSQEKNKRYFQGRIWVDNRDFQIVKLCGKTVPEVRPKKNQPQEVRPTFVGYRQYIDGSWFPAYARIDDTLQFRAESVHVKEILRFKNYKRGGAASASSKP